QDVRAVVHARLEREVDLLVRRLDRQQVALVSPHLAPVGGLVGRREADRRAGWRVLRAVHRQHRRRILGSRDRPLEDCRRRRGPLGSTPIPRSSRLPRSAPPAGAPPATAAPRPTSPRSFPPAGDGGSPPPQKRATTSARSASPPIREYVLASSAVSRYLTGPF